MMRAEDLFWPVLGAAAVLAGFGLAWFAPDAFWPGLGLAPAVLLLAWAVAFPARATALWLLVVATCPEMWLTDLLRLPDPERIIGLDKAAGLVLVLFCVLRYGSRLHIANPALAYPAMACCTGFGRG